MTRDDFIDLVYEELSEDSDNCRANRIIDAAELTSCIWKWESGKKISQVSTIFRHCN